MEGNDWAELYQLRKTMETLKAHPRFQEFFEEAKEASLRKKVVDLRNEADQLEKTLDGDPMSRR